MCYEVGGELTMESTQSSKSIKDHGLIIIYALLDVVAVRRTQFIVFLQQFNDSIDGTIVILHDTHHTRPD